MDAYKAIITKRDRREYDFSRPLAEEHLHRILQAGRMAGSSANTQPCRFIVIRDQAVKDSLKPFGRGIGPLDAPVVVVVALKVGARDFDVGRAVQNMFLAAWADGILSCPVGLQEKEGARLALGIPEDFEVAMGAGFGYPSGEPSARRASQRLPLEEIVHWERW
jgi:nitroreductase